MNQQGAQLTKLRTDLMISKKGENPADKERAEQIQKEINRLERGLENVAEVAREVAEEDREKNASFDELQTRPNRVAQALREAPNIDEDKISLPKVGSLPSSQELQDAGAEHVKEKAKEPTDSSGRAKSQFNTRDAVDTKPSKAPAEPKAKVAPTKTLAKTKELPKKSATKTTKKAAKPTAKKAAKKSTKK